MADYTLYCFAQSGNAYKAALMLELAGADWAPRLVDYFGGETRSPEFRAINVMGEVPVLEHRGKRLTQSGVILDYLAETTGKFGPADGDADERRDVLRWLLYDNHKLTSYTATYRFLRTLAKDANPAVVEEFGKRARTAWGVLNAHLDGRSFVVAARPTIADLSLSGYLFWPDELGVEWDEFPHVRDWLARIRALPRWKAPYELMPGRPPANAKAAG
jgi:glutathione S-transferase